MVDMRQQFSSTPYFWLVSLLALFPHCVMGQRVMGKRPAHDPYSFACRSRHYMLEDFEKLPTIPSPDKTKSVQLTKDYKFQVSNNGAVISRVFDRPEWIVA